MEDNCTVLRLPRGRRPPLSVLLAVAELPRRVDACICLLLWIWCAPIHTMGQRLQDFATPKPLPAGSTLVIGFLGGLESWDDRHRGVRKVVLDLRMHAPNVFAETVENRHVSTALKLLAAALDANRNGRLEPEECASAQVVLFGHSLGGSAAIRTAQTLQQWGVPVILTVQVDSFGLGDAVIPPNVSNAANYHQSGLFTIQGRSLIRAADPQRTRILGNFLRTYPSSPRNSVRTADASQLRLMLGGGHARMEADADLWVEVEQLIMSTISKNSAEHPTSGRVQYQ